jgi:hypothetical protein
MTVEWCIEFITASEMPRVSDSKKRHGCSLYVYLVVVAIEGVVVL